MLRQLMAHPFSDFYRDIKKQEEKVFCGDIDDIYLVSYPRSGNTWLRAILAEIMYGNSGESIKDLQYYVPDIHRHTLLNSVIDRPNHVIKSHHPLRRGIKGIDNYRNIIYLIRNPQDVVISYYRYMLHLRNYDLGFEQFLLDWLNGRIWPCSWHEHVRSWLGQGSETLNLNLYLLKYENLLSQPAIEIANLASQFNIAITSEQIQQAIDKTSVEKMQIKETHGMPEHEISQGFQFIRGGSTHPHQLQLSSAQIALINHYFADILPQYGYGK
jgi:estrone sulfotransferase